MKYCKECGHQMKENATFCPNCGTKTTQAANGRDQNQILENEQTETLHKTKSSPKRQPSRRPVSKQTKIIVSAAAAFIILLIGSYFVGDSIYSKANTADAFQDAVKEQDTDRLGTLLYSDDSNLEIDEAKLESFIDYLEEYPSYQSDLVQSISQQAKADDSNESNSANEDSHFQISKNGKKWLVFDNYQIEVTPVYFTLATDYEDTELYMNDEKVATADNDEYTKQAGPFLTGIYNAGAELTNDYAELENEQTIELNDGMTEDNVVDLTLDAGYTSVESDEGMEGTLIVNEADTDLRLGDDTDIGPIPLDGSVSLQIEHDFPWGEETSKEIPIEESSIYIDEYPVSEELKDTLTETTNKYVEQDAEAYNAMNADKLENVSDDLHSDISDDIERLKDRDDNRQIKPEEVVYDLDSFGISQDDNTYYANVDTIISSQEDTYDSDDDADLQDSEDNYSFSFVYDDDEDEWVVDELFNNYNSPSENTEAFKMDEDDERSEDGSDDEEDADVEDELAELMEDYQTEMYDAVNNDDFSLVEPYLVEGSELHESQEDLVDHLNDKGTTEELQDYDIKDTNCDEDNESCQIDVDETVEIMYESGDSEETDYSWTYTAEETDDDTWKLKNIEER